jgi:hypothetical protein
MMECSHRLKADRQQRIQEIGDLIMGNPQLISALLLLNTGHRESRAADRMSFNYTLSAPTSQKIFVGQCPRSGYSHIISMLGVLD